MILCGKIPSLEPQSVKPQTPPTQLFFLPFLNTKQLSRWWQPKKASYKQVESGTNNNSNKLNSTQLPHQHHTQPSPCLPDLPRPGSSMYFPRFMKNNWDVAELCSTPRSRQPASQPAHPSLDCRRYSYIAVPAFFVTPQEFDRIFEYPNILASCEKTRKRKEPRQSRGMKGWVGLDAKILFLFFFFFQGGKQGARSSRVTCLL